MEETFTVAELYENRDCAQFTEVGMEGVERKNPNLPVSIMSLAARQSVDGAELRGLCYARFSADITLECEGLPHKGTIIGTDKLQLGILAEGKRCWPECFLLQNRLPCPLIDGVRYAWVVMPGLLCRGDRLMIINTKEDAPI